MLAAVYGAAAWFCISSLSAFGFARFIWPPAGIALAALVLYGFDLWPGIFLGAFFAYLFHGMPIPMALIMGITSACEALAGFYLLTRLYFERSLERVWDVIVLVAVACAMSTLAGAAIGIMNLLTGNTIDLFSHLHTWTWWIGDVLGIIFTASFLLVWLGRLPRITFNAMRLAVSVSLVFLFAVILTPSLRGFNLFVRLSYATNLLITQAFLFIISVAVFVSSALYDERRKIVAQSIREGTHIKTLSEWLKENMASIGIFSAIMLPVILLTIFGLVRSYQDSTNITFSERKAIAQLAAINLTRQFDRVIDVETALTDRKQLKSAILKGDWAEAIKNLKGFEKDFPYFDLAALYSPEGIRKDVDRIEPGVRETIGQSYTFRDWWQQTYRHGNWASHVSDIFKRAPLPQLNCVVVTVPIRSDGKVIGVLLGRITLPTILSWAGDIDVGKDGYVYFVDQFGNVGGHPKYPPEAPIQNYSSLEIVKKIHQGQSGVEIFYNDIEKEERFVAYEPVSKYGWGVITSQNKAAAFAARDRALFVGILFDLVIIICAIFLSIFISDSRQKLSYYAKGLKTMVEERTRKLAEAQARDDAILMNIGEGLVATDISEKIIFVNQSFEKLLGWKSEEVIGKDFGRIILREDASGKRVSLKDLLFSPVPKEGVLVTPLAATFYFSRKDKTKFPASLIAAPIIVNGERVGIIETFRDITEQARIDEAKTEFISLASHQLRTPISAIRWLSELLAKKEKLNMGVKQYVKDIHFSALRLERLIELFLNVSRVESGGVSVLPEPLEIVEFINEYLNETRIISGKKNISIFFKDHPDKLDAMTDRNMIEFILDNLVSNAIDYTMPGGRIEVVLAKKENDALLTVRDNGVGIPEKEQMHILEKFIRASNAPSMQTDATGLGLYIVSEIVRLLDGKVWFESEVGKGSVFFVSFPLTAKPRTGKARLFSRRGKISG